MTKQWRHIRTELRPHRGEAYGLEVTRWAGSTGILVTTGVAVAAEANWPVDQPGICNRSIV